MARLASLPTEIILRIFECGIISQHELKSLRLVCRRLSDPARLALFSRICISKLKSDWEAFFNIATRPHLARAVRTVVWFEMAEDELSFVHLHSLRPQDPPLRNSQPRGLSENMPELDSLAAQAREMFWLPFEDLQLYVDEEEEAANKRTKAEARTEAIETVMPWFYAALDSMPNLITLVSQPMHPLRELAMPSDTPGYPMTAQIFQRGIYASRNQMNEGFCTFMIPYMLRRANSSKLQPITRLHVADEGPSSFVTRIKPEFAKSFACLSRLDICVSHIETAEDVTGLAQCLQAAVNLTELRLCFERCNRTGGVGTSDALGQVLLPNSQWPKLRVLHLDDVPFTTPSLVRIVKGLTESLRVLRFDYCPLTVNTLLCLARVGGLNLERFIATVETGDAYIQYEEEKRVLQTLNGNGESIHLRAYSAPDHYIYTSIGVFDLQEWRTAALFQSRTAGSRLGHHYSIAEMRELEQEEREAEFSHQDGETNGDNDDDDDDDNGGPVPYSAEEASHQKRLLSAPRWNWSRTHNNDIYYWKVTHRDVGQMSYPTEVWRFTHRNGESALGDDPLEFWDDWEGSEAGDVYEATPQGDEFHVFVNSRRALETEHLIPFERAVKWFEEDETD